MTEAVVILGRPTLNGSFEKATVFIDGKAEQCFFVRCELRQYVQQANNAVGAMHCHFEDCVVYAQEFMSGCAVRGCKMEQVSEVHIKNAM